MTRDHLGPIFGRPEATFELSYTRKRVDLIKVILHWFYILFLLHGGHLGATLGGLGGDLGPPGLILGHPVALFEAMLHRKVCELENVDFTLVLYAFLMAWKLYRGYV